MPYSYLKVLDLSKEAEQALQSLGARSPASLLSMIEHSRASFARLLGEQQTQSLYEKLVQLVPTEEREKLKSLPQFQPKFGALRVSQSESPQATAAARRERDQLMHDIKLLRESDDESTQKEELLQELEQRLRDILKATLAVNQP